VVSPEAGGYRGPRAGHPAVVIIFKEVAPMAFLSSLVARFSSAEEGQGLAEYALILALIAIVAIVALIFLGGQVSRILSTVGSSV
jgi:pilus assembly protein Flp/PilA